MGTVDWSFWFVLLSGSALGFAIAHRERLYDWLLNTLDAPEPEHFHQPSHVRVFDQDAPV